MTTALAESPRARCDPVEPRRGDDYPQHCRQGPSDNELKNVSVQTGLDSFCEEIWFIKAGGRPVV